MLGSSLRMLHQPNEAVQALHACIEKDRAASASGMSLQGCRSVWRILGLALHETREEEAAEEALMRAIEIEPSDSQAHYGLGLVLGLLTPTPTAL